MKAFLPNGSRWFADTPVEVMDRWLSDPQLLDWFDRSIELTELHGINDALARTLVLVGSPAVREQVEETSLAAALRGALANSEVMLATALGPFVQSVAQTRGEEWLASARLLALPPGPRCERCQHSLCPCCPSPWCDTLVPTSEHDLDAGDFDLCCDGECVVDPLDFAAWQTQLRAVGAFEQEAGTLIGVQGGPFWPARARGVQS